MGLLGDLFGFFVSGGVAAGTAINQNMSRRQKEKFYEQKWAAERRQKAAAEKAKRDKYESRFSEYKVGYEFNYVGEYKFICDEFAKLREEFRMKFPPGSVYDGFGRYHCGPVFLPDDESEWEAKIEELFKTYTFKSEVGRELEKKAREWAAKNGYCPSNVYECIWPGWRYEQNWSFRATGWEDRTHRDYDPSNYDTRYIVFDVSKDAEDRDIPHGYTDTFEPDKSKKIAHLEKLQNYYNSKKRVKCDEDAKKYNYFRETGIVI